MLIRQFSGRSWNLLLSKQASQKKADAAVRQAARDVIISLKDDLQEKLRAVVREAAAQAMTPEAMARAGVEILARGVAMKPGMACAYGTAGKKANAKKPPRSSSAASPTS